MANRVWARLLDVLVIAHRGASVAEVENTPEAFEAADRMGADGVELDVRVAITPDRGLRLVVHHDALPDAATAAGAAVIDALPGLDDVLDACGDRMLVNVEIKNSETDGGFDPTMAVVAPTIDTLRRRGVDDRWLVSSFSPSTVGYCRAVAPEIATAWLCEAADAGSIAAAATAGHRAIHPGDRSVTAAAVTAAHAAGLAVNVWTVNDPDRIRELDEIGVDGVCTDAPDIALSALGRGAASVTPRWGRRA